jgi:hypothetical protein
MTGYSTILHALFTERNPEKAVELTIDRDPENAYSFYKYVRQRIYGNDAYRHPQYLQRVRHLQHVHYGPQDPEWHILNTLMEGSLRSQYRVETARAPHLPAKSIDQALKSIPSVREEFYDYRMPLEIARDANDRLRIQRELRYARPVTISNIQTIIEIARNVRDYKRPWDLVACASILCGRRTQEIVRDMEYEVESQYQIRVKGLCKQIVGAGVVPILCPAETFMEVMAEIREHRLPIDSSTHRLKPAFMRVFGKWYNHSERRNIYCEAAWRMRHQSGFYPEMGKVMWFDKALCHDGNVIHQAPNLTYQAAQFSQ